MQQKSCILKTKHLCLSALGEDNRDWTDCWLFFLSILFLPFILNKISRCSSTSLTDARESILEFSRFLNMEYEQYYYLLCALRGNAWWQEKKTCSWAWTSSTFHYFDLVPRTTCHPPFRFLLLVKQSSLKIL